MNKVRVAGVGMIPFTKPGQSEDWDVMAEKAIRLSLADAGVSYDQIQQAYAGYVYGDSTAGQSALYRVGVTGIPIVNVNNNCSTGSTALYLARQMVEAGVVECVLAVGFEQMLPGALGMMFNDRKRTLDMALKRQDQLQAKNDHSPFAAQQFGGAGLNHQARYGTSDEAFGLVSVKARRHAANNPMALFRDPITLEEVMASKHLYGPITRFQACPPTCGAAAAVLVSPAFAAKHNLDASVEIVAQALTTDMPGTFEDRGMMSVVGYDMAKEAARQVYETAGVGPDDIQAVELHDCFTPNELISYEALGLTAEGTAEQYIRDGQNSYGGKHVINPSGGLLSKGHPLGATGLAQCFELTHQLRGTANKRQVENMQFALQHNVGLGGACVVTLYGKAA
ncbi:lipid-transfer protein [Sphingomonas sp. So64.6b]|uniref:lipid-transfer protein n=1 Tax=Sphingomonas sp. So64.6b TaxID=2997354 RepID=UPI001602DA7D|nr:lipid-transfer protein [Sphingomonas sp. So64.6b]QNA85533.1 lipid-transfer protein [Sphingomonas sp. So64.6b]